MNINRIVAENIKFIRNTYSHSLRHSAELAGIGTSTLSRIENQKSPINIETVSKIANVYDVDVHLLLIDGSSNRNLYKQVIDNKTKINITLEDLIKCQGL